MGNKVSEIAAWAGSPLTRKLVRRLLLREHRRSSQDNDIFISASFEQLTDPLNFGFDTWAGDSPLRDQPQPYTVHMHLHSCPHIYPCLLAFCDVLQFSQDSMEQNKPIKGTNSLLPEHSSRYRRASQVPQLKALRIERDPKKLPITVCFFPVLLAL